MNKFKPVRVAVEEGEVGGDKVLTVLLHSQGQFAREVGLSAWDVWQQIVPDKDDRGEKESFQAAKKLSQHSGATLN